MDCTMEKHAAALEHLNGLWLGKSVYVFSIFRIFYLKDIWQQTVVTGN